MKKDERNARVEAAEFDPAPYRSALLEFYDARARDLPWRRDRDPYRVWVSEVMLQQTRVETASPYYERWLERFPTLNALADASIDDVLRAWAGLGYYRRAHYLHRAARLVRERYGGQLPSDAESLRALPGIGEYTAGAIASIAFGQAVPAVDGNVRRVLSRLFDLPAPTPATLHRIAARLVPDARPGDFNQALMEFGSTHCTPRAPACDACPLASLCLARAAGTQLERPRPSPRRPLPEADFGTAVVVAPRGRVLLTRRPTGGLLGGMWEFPGSPAPAALLSEIEAAARRAALAAFQPLDDVPAEPIGTVVHTFSHRRITYHAFRFVLAAEPALPDARVGDDAHVGDAAPVTGTAAHDQVRWVPIGELDDYALPAAQRKIAEKAGT